MKRACLVLWCAICALLAQVPLWAQLPVPPVKPLIGARMPALSPDGKRIAFVYRGDVWIAPATGGQATPLTRHVEMDAFPLFSPDGRWIAFSSLRNGNWDIFVVPADGGEVRQLTYHANSEIAYGWSPDGKYLLFSSVRDTTNNTLFALDVRTLRFKKLTEDYASINYPSYSPDGRMVVYGRYGFHWTRPRYVGSAAAQIWLLDVVKNTRRALTSDNRQHLWTKFLPDGKSLVTVTIGEETPSVSKLGTSIGKVVDNPSRTPNLWVFDLEGRGKQLTFFTGGSVRFPTVALRTGDIAFEYEHDLWLLPAGSRNPQKIVLYAAEDEKQNTRRREVLTSGVTEAEPSPDGKFFAFGLRGDIWTVLIDKPKGVAGRSAEIARRLTDWAGDDSDFVWSADGKRLYFTSDREFNTRLYELDIETLQVKSLWNRPEDVTAPRLSPDGKQLGFWVSGSEGGLYVLTLETGETRRLAKVPGPHWYGLGGGQFAWSPDMRWIAFTYRGEDLAWNIWILPATGGDPINVTRLNAYHSQPAWSPDGKYLFFQSDRDGNGLYVLPLKEEPARTVDTDLKYEKPKEKVLVEIDFQDIQRRIRKVVNQNPQADLTVSSEGLILFVSEGDIWSVSYDGKETKRLTTGGGISNLRVSADGKRVFFIRNGELWTMRLEGNNPQEKVTFTADWDRDVRAERKAAFTQFWRSYHRGFYDANFHGRDWEAIRKRYEPLLDAVETREEFATLLQMMVGELEASHSEVSPAPGGNTSPVTPHLGFTFDYSYEGPGIKVGKVPQGAPGSYPQTRIREGEYVLAINGQDVTLDENLWKLINDKQEREFEFLVNSRPSKDGARVVKYRVLSSGEWSDLMYRNRIERLRKYTDEKSGGKIGYVHISGMGFSNQVQFEREVYEQVVGKQAMIIDVRFNGGGNISDTLVDWLERKPHGFYRPRDGVVEPAPSRAWDKPIIVLMNEHSYSNAEMFPYAMRAKGLAKLVGMPTPGYVIWTWGLQLVDGTGARMPQSGVYRLDGTPMENIGEKPDVQVWMSPEDWLAERDPQLDKAIEMLMR